MIATALIGPLLVRAYADPIDGTVYIDRNSNGHRDPGEAGVPGAVVGTGLVETTADDRGRFHINAAAGSPVWVRTFDGFARGPIWGAAARGLELGLTEAPVETGDVRIVLAADTHVGREPDDEMRLVAALGEVMADRPRAVVLAGDVTQGGTDEEFDQLERAVKAAGAPVVLVPGNHDLWEGDTTWLRRYGPDVYSLDLGAVHLVVLDSMRPAEDLIRFVAADLTTVSDDATVVVCTHGPPERELSEALAGEHVDLVLAGHWHLNRTIHRDAYLELDTEPLIMGGMGPVPAGFRVITILDGRISVEHRTVTTAPVLAIARPLPSQCVSSMTPFDVLVAAAPATSLEATIDGTPMSLVPAGGWIWRGRAPAIAKGKHEIRISGMGAGVTGTITVCEAAAPRANERGWPQLGGGPSRSGIAAQLPTDLAPRWVSAVGGHLLGGVPVVGKGTVYVAALDLATDSTSAVVALDLEDGHERWRYVTGAGARNGLAVADDVVIASVVDGEVFGLDAETGELRWRVDLGVGVLPEHSMTLGAPLVIGDRVLVGNQRRFTALDVRSGAIVWERDLVPHSDGSGSYVSPSLIAGRVIAMPKPWIAGYMDLDPATGDNTWTNLTTCSNSASAAPVAYGQHAIVIAGSTQICDIDPMTGDAFVVATLDGAGFDWGYAVSGTPAISGDMLYVATHYGAVYAVNLANREVVWRRAIGLQSPIAGVHYHDGDDPVMGSPIVAGDVVWVGAADGRVLGLATSDGRVVKEISIGVPILSGLAPAGDLLIVAGYDGEVRAYGPVARSATDARHWTALLVAGFGIAVIVLVTLHRRRARATP